MLMLLDLGGPGAYCGVVLCEVREWREEANGAPL